MSKQTPFNQHNLAPLWSNGWKLATFASVTTLLIGLTFLGTQDNIRQQQQQQLLLNLNQVIDKELHDNDLANDCVLYPAEIENQATHVTVYRARKAQQNTALAIKTHTNTGYNGRIRLLVGIDVQGTVLGVRALSHKETPGLGDKIDLRHSDWVLDFAGKTLNSGNDNAWKVRKDGGQFDQFTGATITPRAVVSAVKQSLILFETEQQAMFDMTSNCHLENTDE